MWLLIIQTIAVGLCVPSLIWVYLVYYYYSPIWSHLKKFVLIPLIGNGWVLHDRDRKQNYNMSEIYFGHRQKENDQDFAYPQSFGIVTMLHNQFKDGLKKNALFTAGYIYGIATRDHEFVEFITSSPKFIRKSLLYPLFLNDWLGDGLLLSDASKWRARRKLLTPAYHFKILENYIDNFENNADILINLLQKEVGKASFDIQPYLKYCSLDIICETAMGTRVNAQLDSDSTFVQAVEILQRTTSNRVLNPAYHLKFLYKLSNNYRQRKRALEIVHGFRANIVQERRKVLLANQGVNAQNDDSDFGIKKRKVFLDLLLQTECDGKPLGDEAINEEMDTFMFEGHDTVSAALTFAIYLISNHSEVQDRLIDEQSSIFADDVHRKMSYNDLQSMKYLEMVIKESLRLYPSVPYFFREVTEEFRYKDLLIRKGMQICIFAYGLHRDPDYYPDPDKFDPERFTPENQNARNPFVFQGFSAGPRNCIGQKFAMLELKAVMSKLLRSFTILPTNPRHEVDIGSDLTITTRNGVCIGLKCR